MNDTVPILKPLLENTWIMAILAIATLVGGIAAIDQLCESCVRKFYRGLKDKFRRLWRPPPILLESPEGPVPLASPFYMEPACLPECYQELERTATLIRIKAPRQMGKTSMLARLRHHAEQQGCRTVTLSLEKLHDAVFVDTDTFLQHLCMNLTKGLQLPDFDPAKHWQKRNDCNMKCDLYIAEHLLGSQDRPLMIGLDEVDRVFAHPEVAKDFFALLRGWHVEGKSGNAKTWGNLKLVITHSQEVYASLPFDISKSPFNVGLGIQMMEFTVDQVQELVKRHGLTWGREEVDRLMALVGGHPYLVRNALYEIARGRLSLTKLLAIAATDEGCYYEHLHNHLLTLQAKPSLAAAMKKVVQSEIPVLIGADDKFKLRSMGLVRYQGDEVVPLCDLYRRYFRTHLNLQG